MSFARENVNASSDDGHRFSSGALPDELSSAKERLTRFHDSFYGDELPDNDAALDALARDMDVVLLPDGGTIILPLNGDGSGRDVA